MGQTKQIAVVFTQDQDQASDLLRVVRSAYRPNVIVAASIVPPPEGAPLLLSNRPVINGKPTVYVCEGFVCKNPVTSVGDLEKLLYN